MRFFQKVKKFNYYIKKKLTFRPSPRIESINSMRLFDKIEANNSKFIRVISSSFSEKLFHIIYK